MNIPILGDNARKGRRYDPDLARRLNEEAAREPVIIPVRAPEQITPASNIEGFRYIPSIGLNVSLERKFLNKNWRDAQTEARNQGVAIPTPYQFREFLKYMRDSNNAEDKKVFKEITEVRNPWRSNWLNARFEKKNGEMYMFSENVLENGKYVPQEQKLVDFLSENKTLGISLYGWLNSNAPHGLPMQNVPSGDLYYWAPSNGTVARFLAGSDRANFYCGGYHDFTDASLGVFVCMEVPG